MIAEYLDGYFYNDGNPMTSFSGGVDEVLALVPSYEKWIGVKQQRDLENKLRHDSDNKNWQLRTQNAQLKELLEWCRDELFEVYSNEVSHPEDVPIIKKLYEVLKCGNIK